MAELRPFRAYRPRIEMAVRVASPPYDVVSTAEARALAVNNPMSFLHVSRPEIDLPEGTDEHHPTVYTTGARNLTALIADGVLVQDQSPHLYLYAQQMGTHRQVGVVGCASVAEYDQGRIKKHENTRPDKEDDRTRHIEELRAHDEPVFLTYRTSAPLAAAIAAAQSASPIYDFTTDDGVQHQFWVLSSETSNEVAGLFETVMELYVADGHHRSAAASRVHRALRGDGGEHDVFLAVVFPHDQVQILPYNRVVKDPADRSPEELLAALRERMDVQPLEDATQAAPTLPRTFGIYTGKRWYRARPRPGSFDASDPVASLDCSICQDQILGPIFQVTDPRRDPQIECVGGIRGIAELERRVDSGSHSMAIALHPTQVDELLRVSDVGLLMPPKSTWFEPKLRSGLFVHAF